MKEFNYSIRDIFGPNILPDDFPDVNLEDTPLYYMYKEDTTDDLFQPKTSTTVA